MESNSYFTIRFDSKPMQLFEIFKYLSLVYAGDLNAVFGNYNGDYSRRKGDKLSQFRANTVAVFGNYYRQKLFDSIRNFK